jgi:hypothetical protein
MGPIIIVVGIIIITIIIIMLCGYGSFSDDWTNETSGYRNNEVENCKMILKQDRIDVLNNLQF